MADLSWDSLLGWLGDPGNLQALFGSGSNLYGLFNAQQKGQKAEDATQDAINIAKAGPQWQNLYNQQVALMTPQIMSQIEQQQAFQGRASGGSSDANVALQLGPTYANMAANAYSGAGNTMNAQIAADQNAAKMYMQAAQTGGNPFTPFAQNQQNKSTQGLIDAYTKKLLSQGGSNIPNLPNANTPNANTPADSQNPYGVGSNYSTASNTNWWNPQTSPSPYVQDYGYGEPGGMNAGDLPSLYDVSSDSQSGGWY